jgi:hypothetical protein
MDGALLQTLVSGSATSSQLIGGLVVVLLYATIGLLSAIGSIFIVRRMFQGRWEQVFWACFLIMVAAFYLGFAAFFRASPHAWGTEIVAVAMFVVCGVVGLFFRPAIALGFVLHGLWDLTHSLSGSSFAALSLTEIPLGYGLFCVTYDVPVAYYLMTSDTAWRQPGKFNPWFWRQRA